MDTPRRLAAAIAASAALGLAVPLADAQTDTTAPTILGAKATALGEITVTFSEPLTIRDTAAQGWSVSGTDAASHVVVSSTTASDSDSIVLTLDKNLEDTKPDGVLLRYETSGTDVGGDAGSGSGAIADPSSNPLAARANIPVSDGVAPDVLSSEITGPSQITVAYSEAVTAARAGYASATVGTPRDMPSTCELPGDPCRPPIQAGSAWTGTPHGISSLSGSGTAVHTLAFDGEVGTDAVGFVTINSAQVVDGAGNALGDSALSSALSDGQAPAIESATAIEPNKITVKFSEDLAPDGTVAQACPELSLRFDPQCENPASYGSAAQGWSVSGGDAAGRAVVSGAGSGRYLVLTLDADLADTRPDGVLLQYKTSPGDVGSDAGSGSGRMTDLESNALAAVSSITVSDSLAPTVSAKYASRNSVYLEFSEPVRLSSAGPPTGWAVSGADKGAATGAYSVSVITASDTGTSAALTLDGDLADKTLLDFTLEYAEETGNIEDESGNALAPYSEKPSDGIAPRITWAVSSELDEITVAFSEAIDATPTGATATWTLGGSNLPSGVEVGANPAISTGSTVLTLSGDLNDPIGNVTLAYNDGAGDAQDKSGNALASQTVAVGQNVAPAVSSARITGPSTAEIAYSEPVTAVAADYSSLVVGGQARDISGLSGGATAVHTVTFTGGDPFGTDAVGSVSIGAAGVKDALGKALGTGALSQDLADGQSPTVSAKYTARNAVELAFSEPVRLSAGNAPTGWTVSGADSGTASAASSVSVITTSATSTSATLTLDGDLADKTSLDFTLAYASSGNIEDQSGNALAPYSAEPADGIAPEISSARVTGPTTITVTYGEAVTAGQSAYSPPIVDNYFRTVSAVSGSGTAVHTLTFTNPPGTPAPGTGATGSVTVAEAEITDESGNAMGAGALMQDLADGQKPTITSAKATALNQITVTFSEDLTVSGTNAQGWSVSGGDAAGRTVDSSTPVTGGNTTVLTLSSDMDDTKPDGVVLRYKTSAGNAGGDAGSGSGAIADPSSNALAARASIAVSDGIAPEISSATYTGRNTVDLAFSEPVRLSSGTVPAGWSAAGADVIASPTAGSAITVLTTSAAATSAELTLDNDLADKTLLDFTLEYAAGTGNIEDESGNALAAYSEKPNDGIAPDISSSRITGHHQITIAYSEAVTAARADYISALIRTSHETSVTPCERHGDHYHCQVGPPGTPYDISSLSGSGTAVHTLEIHGEVGTEATGFIFIDSARVVDGAGNALGAFPITPQLSDGQAPEIESATATGSNEITVEFSEDLAPYGSVAQGWSISGADAAGLHVSSSTAAHADSIVLTLDGDLADTKPDRVELRYKTSSGDVGSDAGSGSGRIADLASNAVVAVSSMTVSDGLAPTVSAKYASRNSVDLEFSEPVWLSSGSAPTGWTVSGTDRGGAAAASEISVITTSVTSTSATLTLDGDLADKTLLDFTLEYAEETGNIEDESGNHLADYSDAPSDGIAPRIVSVQPNALDAITVAFSEAIDATPTGATATWTLGGSNLPPGVEVGTNPAISTGSTVLTLSGDLNDPIGDVTLAYNDGAGDAQDKSGNALAAQTVQLDQNLPPSVSSARITGPSTVKIAYSEPVTAVAADYSSLVVGGQARDISGLSGGTTAVHTVTFTGGTPPGGDAVGSVSIDAPSVKDATDKALGAAALSQPLSDGQSPEVSSAKYTSRNAVEMEFSEPVRLSSGSAPTGWTVSGTDRGGAAAASAISVITTSVTSSSATLTLDGDLADKTLLDFTLSYAAGGNIEDGGGNALAAYSATPGDGIAPAVSSAKYTSRNAVEMEFSEPVRLSSGSAPTGWTVSGADAGSATGASSAAVSGSATPVSTSTAASEVTLTLDGDLADKTLLDFTLSYASSGNIEDGGGNALEAYSAKPSDGFAPTMQSAKVTSSNEITITFSEPVVTIVSHYSSSVTVAGTSYFVTGSETGTVERVILRFTGTPFGAGAAGNMTVNATQVKDQANNALGTETARPVDLTDGQSPTISSAKATAPDKITVEFSESLPSYDAVGQGWSISGGDAAGRQVVSGAGSGSRLVLTLNADLDDTRPDGVLLQYKTSPGDVGSDADSGSGVLQDGASNALAARSSVQVSDGIAPEVSSSRYTARDTVDLEFSEPVRLSSGTVPTGWSAAGADVIASPTAGSAITVLTTSATATSAALTLDSDLADKTLLDFTLEYAAGTGNIEDESGNALAPYSEKPSDGIAPRITSAVSSMLDEITVTFSENVDATSTSAGDTWTLGGADLPAGVTVDRNPPVSAGTTVLGLSGDLREPIGTVTLAYDDGTGDVEDESDNALASQTVAVGQDLAPAVSSAKVAGPDRVVIEYSEPVTAAQSDYTSLVVGGQARDISSLSGGTTDTHTITFSGGDSFGTDAVGSVSIDAAGVKDATDKALGTGVVSQPLSDGQSPTVSAKYTARNSVELEFSEPVRLSSAGAPTGWTVSGADKGAATAASAVSVITASNTDTSAALTLDGNLADKTLLNFTLSYASGNIEDDDDNPLEAYSATPDDGIAPQVSSAKYTSRDTVDLTFSEPVRLSSGNMPTEWTVSGTDAGAATGASYVSVITTSTTSTSATLTLNGNLADKTLLDFTLAYAAGGNIEDQSDNVLAAYSAKPNDGFAPKISSAKVTGPREITIVYSETVSHNLGHYNSINVGGSRLLSNFSGANTDTAVLTFSGGAVGTDATGTVQISAASIRDGSNNALGSVTITRNLTDGQAPTFTAKAIKLNEIEVTFSENMDISDTTAQGWSVSGTDAAGRTVDSSTAVSNGNTVVLTLSSNMADTKPDGVVLRYKTSPGDVTGDANSGSGAIVDQASNALEAKQSTTVSDGVKPVIDSAKVTGPGRITITYSEAVTASQSHYPGAAIGGQTATISSISGQTSATHVISFIVPNPAGTGAEGSVTINAAQVKDGSNNALGTSTALSQNLDDGQNPSVASATVTDRRTIQVAFSEDVRLSGAGTAPFGWAISGTDAASRSVLRIDGLGTAADAATLVLDGDIADTTDPAITVAYSGGNIEDTSGNDLAAYAAAAADDGIAPRIESATATSLTTIKVSFSESVDASSANAQGWSISGTDAASLSVTASTSTSSGRSTVLTLSGSLADTNPDNAVLRYKTSAGNVGSDASSGSGAIADLASNAMAARANIPVSDAVAPTASFALTDDDTVTVSFSEDVSSSDNAASHWTISGADAAGLSVSSVSSLGSSIGSMTVALSGSVPVPFTDLKLAYSAGGAIRDGASLVLAAIPATAVSDERRPAITSAEATGPRTIVVTFSRDVSSSASAQDLLSAWSVSGGDADSPARLGISGISSLGSETRSMTVTLDGDLPDTKPDGVTLSFDATPSPGTTVPISDSSSRSLADASVSVDDGIAPEVESTEATGLRTIVATFSENVQLSGAGTAPFGWAISGTDANGAEVDSISDISESASGTSATLNLDRDIADTTDPAITMAYSGGNIEDTSGNDLAAYAAAAADDGIAPTVESATVTDRRTIRVVFSESVQLSGAGTAPFGWAISGIDAASAAVNSISDISESASGTSATLNLDRDIADTTDPSITVAYSGGNIEDTSGNDLASYAAAAAGDGIAPTFTARATALDKIAVTFSETVTATGTAGAAGWSISGGDWNSRVVDSRSDISSGSTSLVLTLNGGLADTKPDGVVLRYDPAAGDAQDAAGNETSGTAAVSDGIAPAIASAESRQADKITVTFSEPVSGTATAPGTTWTLSGAGSGGRTITVYGAFSESLSVDLTVSSAFADPIGAVTLTYAQPPGDIKDTADLALAGEDVTVTQNLAPFISSAEATSLDTITVTFSEAVRGTATNPSDTWILGGADAAGITVSRYPAPSGTSVVLGLSGNLPDPDPDLSLQYVRTPGDVEDLTGTPLESTEPPHVSVSDGLAPALSSAALNEGTGVLALAFTETIDVSEMNESDISIREQGASSGGVALSSSARTTAADSATVSFTLTESDRQSVIAMATPQLDVSAGAVRDLHANLMAATADLPITAAPDSVRPVLQSASLDEGAGTISLTFDEKMATPTAAQAARVEIGTSGANISFAEADITSAEPDSAGTTITITVSEAKRQEIIAATPADIDVLSGGLRDVSGAEASSAGTAFGTIASDEVRPTLASAVLNTDDGVLVLSFSETMDASSFAGELSKVSVATPGDPVQLAGTARADGTNIVVTLDSAVLRSLLDVISAAPNAGAPGLLSLQTTAAPQFTDTSGNAVASVSGNVLIEDGRPPSLVSASVTSPDTIVARFSEDLADGTVQTSDFSVPGYDVSSVSEISGVVTITMANPGTFNMRDAPGVRTAGPVSDLFGNVLEPGAQIQSVNAIMPAVISQFTVSHDGPAKAGDRIQVTFRAQGAVSMDAALRVNGQAVATASVSNGFDATYTVPSGAPQGALKLYVQIISNTGTPTEFSERDLTGPNVVIDTLPPSVVSASIAGIDSVSVIYSEPVTASASDYTGIEADGAAPADASGAIGSGSKSILISWPGAGTTPSSVRLTAGAVTDAAGNAADPSQVTAAAAQTQVELEEPGIPLARGTVVETITAPSGIEPVVDVSSFTGTVTDAAVIGAGGGSAVFESELRIVTRTFGLPDVTFQAGTQAGGLGPMTSGGAAFDEAIAITSSSSTAHLNEDQRAIYPMLFDGITTAVQVGHPGRDIMFDRPVLLEFDIPLRGALVFSVGTLGVPLPIPACDPSWDASALPVAQSVPEGWPPGTYDANACVDEDGDSVWTGHFSLFGVSQPPPRGGSECDDCTPPTLGYDSYGAKLVDAGFSYNGLAYDVEYFFTPYPLIESEVGAENAVVLKIYENEGPGNVIHAALAFGLRSGEVISESRAVINYDISHDGTGAVSVIDPDGAIDLDTLAAEHETVECSPGSELECLQVTIRHAFRAPLEFDIVGTDVWDSQRNSWQNYYNHGIKITGEPLDGRPGIEVNGGELVLHPISPGSTNRDVMVSSDGRLFKLSPDGRYAPLSNQSRLYHDIDESMYLYRGVPMQGYDRGDPQFRDLLREQAAEAQRVLDSMMPAPEAEGAAPAPAPPDRRAEEERLRAAVAAEQERARLLFEELFGYLDINGQG